MKGISKLTADVDVAEFVENYVDVDSLRNMKVLDKAVVLKKDVVLPFYRINVNAGRAVLIKDGNFDTTIVVSNGDEITSFNYKTKTDSITVFGDIRRFYISNTNANITGLDANHMPYMNHLDLNNANVTYLNIYNCSNIAINGMIIENIVMPMY